MFTVLFFLNIVFLKKYVEILFFLFFKIYFLYHHIKIIQKYQKILIESKEKSKTLQFF
jgi:hypothetical protein